MFILELIHDFFIWVNDLWIRNGTFNTIYGVFEWYDSVEEEERVKLRNMDPSKKYWIDPSLKYFFPEKYEDIFDDSEEEYKVRNIGDELRKAYTSHHYIQLIINDANNNIYIATKIDHITPLIEGPSNVNSANQDAVAISVDKAFNINTVYHSSSDSDIYSDDSEDANTISYSNLSANDLLWIESMSDGHNVLNDIITVMDNSRSGVYEAEEQKRANFVKNLQIVYCDHNTYMLLNEDYRRAKIMLNSTALINAGFMTWNDVLINLNNKEVHEKIAEFMHNYLERNNGEFKNGFVLELCDYISSLGFSDKYVQMLVRQFIKDFNK